jgi:uncharacterized protein (DUF302 family)
VSRPDPTPAIGFGKTLDVPFDEAVRRVEEGLGREGFGVLTRIDVRATLKAKLGVEVPPYQILGACNPPLAHRALQRAPEVGLLLPCNVVVREVQGGVRVDVANADAMAALLPGAGLDDVAEEANRRLARVLESLG